MVLIRGSAALLLIAALSTCSTAATESPSAEPWSGPTEVEARWAHLVGDLLTKAVAAIRSQN